ncbi:DNA/RNA helicase domain-containing protein [Kordia zhangzhouensis]|uniref:DNA/RNA helicase domain-containing protein n=1 Tax=Kordia zhangzhouensis TaxID=1620405 RepID=UPI0006292FD0|nr:DNA/RNA helicase domain-containing protein [Kordia zhangzhouensis]
MNSVFDLSIDISKKYNFARESLVDIDKNIWVANKWPLVYFLENPTKKTAYVGESTNFYRRIRNHLGNEKKSKFFNQVSIIGSDKFNKSATLDIESKLIQYISAEETYQLQNSNFGLIHHNYYQQDLYKNIFKEIWNKLVENKIVTKSLEQIENSELFKYSPYKSLNEDQYNSVLEIINTINHNKARQIFVTGSAGTGKTILATYLIKLLISDVNEINRNDLNEREIEELRLIETFQTKYPKKEIAIVVAMTSLRKTLKKVFRKTPGLKSSMVISPSDTFKKSYDLLIVDEAHRLRQYKNIGWMGTFRKNNHKLGLGDEGTELDWIIANSTNQIFFYDLAQSVKPSDIEAVSFEKFLKDEEVPKIKLTSQMRVLGGRDYISFVDKLLTNKLDTKEIFLSDDYELLAFDSLKDLYTELSIREDKYKLCRLIAGYAWPWLSNPKLKPKPEESVYDIELDGLKFKWNSVQEDWINSENAFKEVGCIHTTQGYDLNYSGIIFGEEIDYNEETNEIEINKEKYFDINGKKGVDSVPDLRSYIINIYKTILYRGIRGTFIYACNENLRNYLKKHIKSYKKSDDLSLRTLSFEDVIPYVNAVPYYDIIAAAGDFSELQKLSEMHWIELPHHITVKEGYFICRVEGESMNKKIPNGSLCLFKEYTGGTRNGKIVLVQHHDIQDSDFGSEYTVKQYYSEKAEKDNNWEHTSIILKPMSYDLNFEDIVLELNEYENLKVIGEFITVIK